MAPTTEDQQRGVVFPVVDGSRSTTATGTAVFAAAARAVDPQLAAAIERAGSWRKDYVEHVRDLVAAELRAGAHDEVPRAGLAELERRFVFLDDDGERPLHEAIGEGDAGRFEDVVVRGEGTDDDLAVPYRGRLLRGDDLRRQLDAWVETDTVEPSFAHAVGQVLDHPEWLDLSDRTIAVLGAGAEMGPLASLCRWHANVVAVDLPRPRLWERILREAKAGTGVVRVPVRPGAGQPSDLDAVAAVAGADLITEAPHVAAWLSQLDGPLTLGNYVYADGADHVRVAMAVDAIGTRLLGVRDDVSLAVLVTPTDVYAVPEATVEASRRAFEAAGAAAGLSRTVSGGRLFAPNYDGVVTTPDGARYGLADAVVAQQGPNYSLTKRLQRWRVRAARAAGASVSANLAPATATRSVTKNRILAAAYAGAPRFGVEIFEPETSNTLMAALLVHDLRNPAAAGNPEVDLRHPLELFAQAAAHGGMWRIPYAPRSVLPLAALLGLARRG